MLGEYSNNSWNHCRLYVGDGVAPG